MMKRISFGSLVTVGLLFFISSNASAATNIVQNGDLETASATVSIPQGWSQDSWGTLAPVFSYPVAGKSGGKAAKVQLTARSSGDAKWMFNHIPVTAGATYTYSDDYMATVATEVDVEYKLSSGSFSYVSIGNPAATGSNWGTFTAQIKPPTGAVSMSVLHIIQSVGTLTIDNVFVGSGTTTPPTATTTPPTSTSTPPALPVKPAIASFIATPTSIQNGSSSVLNWVAAGASSTSIDQGIGAVTGSSRTVSPTQTTTYTLTATNPGGSVSTTTTVTVTNPPPPPLSTNLITNGNFEAGATNAPTGWHSDYWGSLAPTFTYPVAGNGGGKAARVVVSNWTSGDAKWWFNHVAVNSHTIYEFSDDFTSTVYSNVTVEFLMSNNTYQYQWVGEAPPAGAGWKHFTAQITVPVGAVSMSVLHALDRNGSLTIDNASLVALPANPFAQGMVTLTFDDGLLSQYQNARPILNTAGIKATYGIITQGVRDISGDTAEMAWAQITQLKNEGNEISSHTRTHADLTAVNATQQQSEIVGAKNDLIAKGFNPTTFIYPLGAENPSIQTQVKNAGYIGARGSYWGLNSGAANRYVVYDIRFDKVTTAAQINAAIAQAVADKRWLIIEFHDVFASGGDDYAITTTKLQTVVNYIKNNNVKTVTLEQGFTLMP